MIVLLSRRAAGNWQLQDFLSAGARAPRRRPGCARRPGGGEAGARPRRGVRGLCFPVGGAGGGGWGWVGVPPAPHPEPPRAPPTPPPPPPAPALHERTYF